MCFLNYRIKSKNNPSKKKSNPRNRILNLNLNAKLKPDGFISTPI